MTLSKVFNEEKTQKILDVMPDVSSVWKVVLMNPQKRCYMAPHLRTKYQSGKAEAELPGYSCAGANYPLFYHFWVKKVFVLEMLNIWYEARAKMLERLEMKCDPEIQIRSNHYYEKYPLSTPIEFLNFMEIPRVISCVIHKDWITTIGTQEGGIAVVCRYAVFPRYPNISPEPNYVFVEDDIQYTSEESEKPMTTCLVGHPKPMEVFVNC